MIVTVIVAEPPPFGPGENSKGTRIIDVASKIRVPLEFASGKNGAANFPLSLHRYHNNLRPKGPMNCVMRSP